MLDVILPTEIDQASFEALVDETLTESDSPQGSMENFIDIMKSRNVVLGIENPNPVEEFSKFRVVMNKMRDRMIESTGNKAGIKLRQSILEKIYDNEYVFFHCYETFFHCWLDIEAPKKLFKLIMDINDRIDNGENITVHIHSIWSEFGWDYILFATLQGCWFHNLIFNILKAKKIVYVDSWCTLGTLVAMSEADEIVVGDFSELAITAKNTRSHPEELQKIFDSNLSMIFTKLINKGLLSQDEVTDLYQNPVFPLFLCNKTLQERAAVFNSRNSNS